MSGVTSQGFESKQYTEIVEGLANKAKTPEYFGEQFPVTPDSKFGIMAGVFGAALKDQWDLSKSVADQGNRDKASGKYLDDLAGLIYLTRLQANGSTGSLLFTGTDNTTVATLTPIRSTANKEIVLTQNVLTLSRLSCYRSRFNIPVVTDGETYTITIGAVPYSVIGVTGQSVATLSGLLVTAINAAASTYTASYDNTTSNITVVNVAKTNTLLTTNTVNINLVTVSSLVEAKAATAGTINFYANTLTTITSPIIGITSVTNLEDFSVGRDEETDAELRIRMETREQSTGTATKPSIEASISDIAGVTTAFIVENITMVDDAAGRPPKSYEVYVTGGLDSAIADVVWKTKPAGVETWGSISAIVVDNNSDQQLVKFSRFNNKYAWVKVTYSINSEEEFLPDGVAKIKAAVVETGSKFYRGEDLEPTKFYGNIYSNVSGVFINKIEVAVTDNIGDTPTYSETRIPIDKISNLLFSNDRVIPLLT